MDPSTLTAKDRQALLSLLRPIQKKTLDYYAGLQLGPEANNTAYWSGPMLPEKHPAHFEMQAALIRGFAFRNATAEVCRRAADSVTGDEFNWSFVPTRSLADGEEFTPDEQQLIGEVEAALNVWWDRNALAQHFQDRAPRLVGFGRTASRPLVMPRYVESGGVIQQVGTLDEALLRLRLMPTNEVTAGVLEDPETLEPLSVIAYETRDSSGITREELELSFVDDQGQTVLRVMRNTTDPIQKAELDLGGRLWLIQASVTFPLITDDLLSQQDALNVALTLLNRNTHFAGFVERYGIGIEPPVDEEGRPKLNVGSGTSNFFQPSVVTETTTDPLGNTTVSQRPISGQYGRFEPSDPKALTAAVDYAEANLYAIARQRFVVMSDDATASGRSREVAAGDYLVNAGRLARAMEGYVRDVLEFALAFAGAIMGQPGRYASLRAHVSCHPRGFQPSAQDRAQDLAELQAGAMSLETFLARRGDADTDAERARLETERQEAQDAPLTV